MIYELGTLKKFYICIIKVKISVLIDSFINYLYFVSGHETSVQIKCLQDILLKISLISN